MSGLLTFVSAAIGFPPFFAMAMVAGTLRMNVVVFFIAGLLGRTLLLLGLAARRGPDLQLRHAKARLCAMPILLLLPLAAEEGRRRRALPHRRRHPRAARPRHARHPRLRQGTRALLSTAPSSRRRRVGVMGGTFDPIHHGHLVAASEVQAWFDLDEVVFVPTGEPWQKSDRVVSPAEHRYLMTVIATASNPRFTVSRVDIDRGGPTYTIDTLRDLSASDARRRPLLHHRRRRARRDLHLARRRRALRAGPLRRAAPGPATRWTPSTLGEIPRDRVTILEIPALAISSTECRERRAKGEPVWYLVPDGVVQYIAKHDLYAPSDPTRQGAPQ